MFFWFNSKTFWATFPQQKFSVILSTSWFLCQKNAEEWNFFNARLVIFNLSTSEQYSTPLKNASVSFNSFPLLPRDYRNMQKNFRQSKNCLISMFFSQEIKFLRTACFCTPNGSWRWASWSSSIKNNATLEVAYQLTFIDRWNLAKDTDFCRKPSNVNLFSTAPVFQAVLTP